MDVYYFIDVGDEVLDRRDLRRRGRVVSVINDGKLSKSFYVVRWDNGVEEMVVLEDLCSLKELEDEKRRYNVVKKESIKESVLMSEKEEMYNASNDEWLNIVISLSKVGFSDDEIVNFIKNGSLSLVVDRFTDEVKNVVLRLKDGSRIVFSVKEGIVMPVKKHLDIGKVEKYIDEKGKEVSKEEFKRKGFLGSVVLRKVFSDAYELDFSDGNPLLLGRDELMKVIKEYRLPKKEVLESLEKKGYWKGELKIFDEIKELVSDGEGI